MTLPSHIVEAARREAHARPLALLAIAQADVDRWVLVNLEHEVMPDAAGIVALVVQIRGAVHFLDAAVLTRPHTFTHHAVHINRLRDLPALRDLMRACWPKEQHETQGAAEAQLRSITKRALEKSSAIHTYRCPVCHHWHVGHRRLS